MKNDTWQLQEAKSKFSQVVDKAIHNGPQFVTRHGQNAVVVLSYEAYQAITKPESNLIEFLRSSPLTGMELDIARDQAPPRSIDL